MATDFSGLPASLQGSFGLVPTASSPMFSTQDSPVSSGNSYSNHPQVAHWYRLFVGWVPRHYAEANLKPIFDRSGDVKDIIILKDKVSGQPKGCAFVSYATEAEAERAIAELDRKIQLPGASSPMEVRFARSHQYIQAGTGPQDNRQLFFSRAPVGASDEELKQVFEQFGMVDEVNIFADRKTNMSKGCGFITMASRDQALFAIERLNEKYVMPGAVTPMTVKWADPDLQSKKKKAVEEANSDKRTVIGGHKESAPSFPGRDGCLGWENADTKVISDWMEPQLPKKRSESMNPPSMMRVGQQNRPGNGGRMCRMPSSIYNIQQPSIPLSSQSHTMRRLDYTHDVPPLGCQSDAIKLFIGNIPKSYTAENLRPLFDQIGTVVELVVVRDKLTDESKGSAFVWYQSRCEAERSIGELHLRHILHDPTGEQDRPLVVRRANPKAPPLLLQAAAVMPQSHIPPAQSHIHYPHQSAMMDSSLDFPEHLKGSFVPGMLNVDQNPSTSISRLSNEFNSMTMQQFSNPRRVSGMNDQPVRSTPSDPVSLQADFLDLGVHDLLSTAPMENPALSHPDSFDFGANDAFSGPISSNPPTVVDNFRASSIAPPVGQICSNQIQNMYVGQMTLALPVTPQQGSVIGANLHTIQAGSGALIQLAPGSNDSYVVMLSGTEAQVNTAKTVVQELIVSGIA